VSKQTRASLGNHLKIAVGLTWLGIVLAVYGVEPLGGPTAIFGMAMLGMTIHKLGRIGADT
jgi:hypothetical protein